MTIMIGKGTALQESIASTFTAVTQVISIDLPEAENETFEADYLDQANAGIPHKVTNRTEGGSLSAELFYDPALASHKKLVDKLSNPVTTGISMKVVFATTTNAWTMTVAGVGLGGTVAINDGVKANVTMKLDGIVSYTTTT